MRVWSLPSNSAWRAVTYARLGVKYDRLVARYPEAAHRARAQARPDSLVAASHFAQHEPRRLPPHPRFNMSPTKRSAITPIPGDVLSLGPATFSTFAPFREIHSRARVSAAGSVGSHVSRGFPSRAAHSAVHRVPASWSSDRRVERINVASESRTFHSVLCDLGSAGRSELECAGVS